MLSNNKYLRLTSTVGVVSACWSLAASRVARREVGQSVGAADRLHVVHVALAPEVARCSQVDLERGVTLIAEKRKTTTFFTMAFSFIQA